MTGIRAEAALGKTALELFPGLERSWIDTFARVVLEGQSMRFEDYASPIGRWFDCYAAPVGAKHEGRLAVVFRDVTERRRADEALRASLAEKEALLKEVHHRVKSNLQVIVSFLNMQERQIKDPHVLVLFDEARNRVFSVAAIHELLYRSASFAAIDLAVYARQLIPELIRFYGADDRIQTIISGDGVTLELERAVPYGLLLNELVSNVCKHAFPPGQRGCLTVSVQRRHDHVFLQIADTGVGLPDGFDYLRTSSLGLQLVHRLSRQLGGAASLHSRPGAGTTAEVRIPLSAGLQLERLP